MGRSLRTERWRFTEWNGGGSGIELYDHAADPNEFHNLARNPSPETVRLIAELRAAFGKRAVATVPKTPFDPAKL
jgi:uncharacterized sulfatase